MGIGLVRVRGAGLPRGSELPCQPLAGGVVGDALERLGLPDGGVELVQQLRLLELIRLVCGGGGLLNGPRERLVGVLGLGYRLMVGVALVVRPVGVAAADARQRHDHRRDDDGGELLDAELHCGPARRPGMLGFVLLGHFPLFLSEFL